MPAAAIPRTGDEPIPAEFDSPAWILIGLTRSVPGWLAYAGGWISFADHDGDALFCVERGHVADLRFPWYYFGGGFKLTVAGEPYRLSLARPNSDALNPIPADWKREFLDTFAKGDTRGRSLPGMLGQIALARRVTAIWRQILTPTDLG